MAKAVWVVTRQISWGESSQIGIFTSRRKMLEALEKSYSDVTLALDDKGKPCAATARHDYFGTVRLWFDRKRLDELSP